MRVDAAAFVRIRAALEIRQREIGGEYGRERRFERVGSACAIEGRCGERDSLRSFIEQRRDYFARERQSIERGASGFMPAAARRVPVGFGKSVTKGFAFPSL